MHVVLASDKMGFWNRSISCIEFILQTRMLTPPAAHARPPLGEALAAVPHPASTRKKISRSGRATPLCSFRAVVSQPPHAVFCRAATPRRRRAGGAMGAFGRWYPRSGPEFGRGGRPRGVGAAVAAPKGGGLIGAICDRGRQFRVESRGFHFGDRAVARHEHVLARAQARHEPREPLVFLRVVRRLTPRLASSAPASRVTSAAPHSL